MKKIYAFTQQLVWESLGYNAGTFIDSSIESEYKNWKKNILSTIDTMDTLPSFNNDTITLNIGETYTLTDTNGRLQHYPAADTIQEGIRFEHTSGSNELKITATENCTKESYKFYSRQIGLILKYGGSLQHVYLFTDGYQKNLYTNGYGTDPVFNLKLKINLTGRLELTKTNTNGDLINGSEFIVWSDDTGYNEKHIVSNGKIVIENLKPGTYHIQELSNEGYLLDTKIYTVNVKANETTTKTIVNSEPTGTITIEKRNTNGDRLGAGYQFQIIADETIKNQAQTVTYYNKGDIVATVSTSSEGLAVKSNLPLR